MMTAVVSLAVLSSEVRLYVTRAGVIKETRISAEEAAHDIAEDLKRNDFLVKPDAISGTVKLNGLEKSSGIQCLNITGEMKVARAKMKPSNDEHALPLRNATIESSFSWLLPVDPALNHTFAYGTVISTYSMGSTAGNGGDFKRELKTTRMYEIRAIPLP